MPEGVISTYESGVDLVVEWKIHNFLNLSEKDCAWYTSSYFSFGGERWRLRIFPNGWNLIDSSGHIDLCLCKRDSNRSIKQSFSLSLKTVRREKYNEQHCNKDFYDNAHKFIRFIQRSDLIRRRSQLLPDGVLTVVCTMKSSTSAVSAGNTASASALCRYCKRTFNADSLSSHQKKCMHRPTKCPDCFEVVVLEKWLNEHECQQERPEAGKEHKTNSENTGVNASTQTEEKDTYVEAYPQTQKNVFKQAYTQTQKHVLRQVYTQTQKHVLRQAYTQTQKHVLRQVSTQTVEEKSLKYPAHVEACTQTVEEKSVSDLEDACTQTVERKSDEWFKENSRNACVDASTQTEEQNEEIKELPATEVDKTDTSEGAKSDETETFGSNQTATKTKESFSLVSLPAEHDLVTDVKDLMKEGRGIDVTFEVNTPNAKTKFFAHQLILALRSPYFADLFYGQGRNKGHQIIPLKGINTKAFEQMIRHCYDYKPCLRTHEDACALFKVAFEFKVISLQNLCHAFIRHTNIDPGNVFSILKISEEMKDQSLQDMCYKILQEKTREVVANYELCDVTSAMVYTLLNLPKLSLNSEYELIKWLFDWAKVKSEDLSSSKNAREYLEKFLKYMNLLALRFEEFAMLCKDNQDFFNPDEIGNISMNIAFPGTREMPDWYGKDLKCRVYTGSKNKIH